MNIVWNWLPNIGLGPISLGSLISSYIEIYKLEIDEEDVDDTGWLQYKFPTKEIYIQVDISTNLVESILSYDDFYYKGKNIIGIGLDELEILLRCKPDEIGESVVYDDADVQTPYDYISIGLQVWTSNSKIVSASCVNYGTA